MINPLLIRHGALAAVVLLGLCLPALPAAAQGVFSLDGVPLDGATQCPQGWRTGQVDEREKRSSCYPAYTHSPKAYRSRSGTCAAGYGLHANQWCVEGLARHPELQRPGVFAKTNDTDRCPAGYHSYMNRCTTIYTRASTARAKGHGECRRGEVTEWGIWCTSNYQHLTARQIRSAALRDYNNIYGYTGKEPRQSPNDDHSEVYRIMASNSPAAIAVAAAAGPPEASTATHRETPRLDCAADEVSRMAGGC